MRLNRAGRTSESGCPAQKRRIFGLAEDVVAGQHLVGALARQDHLEAVVPYQAGQEEHRRRGGPHQRGLGVPDHLREHLADVGVRGVYHVVVGPEGLGHGELERALVVVARP